MNMMPYGATAPAIDGWQRRAAPDPASLLSPLGLVRLLRDRWRLAGAVLTLAVATSLLAASFLPRSYTATAVLLIDPRQPRVSPNEAVVGGIGSDAAAVESQVEIFESTTLARQVIATMGLDREGELAASGGGGLGGALRRFMSGAPAEAEMDAVVQRFQSRLKVRRRGLTYVLEVAYTSGDKATAARVANAVAAAYLADQAAARQDATTRASGWLGERIEELRERARQAEAAVTTFRNANQLVELGQRESLLERQITDLNQQLTLAQARTAENRARFEQARDSAARPGGNGAFAEFLQSSVVSSLRVQYAQLAASEADLRMTYGERHPALTNLRAQMRDVERQIGVEVARISAGLRNEFEAAQAREATLERSLGALRQQVSSSNTSRDRLRELEREAQASRAVLEQFLLRFRETAEQRNLQAADARVISPASPPQQPSSPKTSLILALGLAGGLFGAVGAAALADGIRPRASGASRLEAALGRPAQARIPRLNSAGEAGGIDPEASRSLLPLAAELRRDALAGSRRVVLVTSLAPGEGRTLVAEHLADLLGRSGSRVLLVDLDAGSAGLTRRRGAQETSGVLQLLQRDLPTRAFIQTDPATGVDMLPLGRDTRPGGSIVLLSGPRLDRILDDARASYDVVLLDGPPLLGSLDARALVDAADRTVLVSANRAGAADALSILPEAADPASPIALVANAGPGRARAS